MSDQQNSANDGGASNNGGGQNDGGASNNGGGQNDGGSSQPDWREGLSEDLRGHASIQNYSDLNALVQGHIQTKALASSKLPIPGETPESQAAFADALRPQDVQAYADIKPIEGTDEKFAQAFVEQAHKMGIPPFWAKQIADWNNDYIAAQLQEKANESQQEVDQFKKDYAGNYDEQLERSRETMKMLGADKLTDEEWATLDKTLGSAGLIEFFFKLTDRIGDPEYHGEGSQNQGFGDVRPDQAEQKLKELRSNPEWRKAANEPDSKERKEFERLTRLVAQHRLAQNPA